MGRKSTKENKNIYQTSRETAGLTREGASELLEFISSDRIEKIENEDDVLTILSKDGDKNWGGNNLDEIIIELIKEKVTEEVIKIDKENNEYDENKPFIFDSMIESKQNEKPKKQMEKQKRKFELNKIAEVYKRKLTTEKSVTVELNSFVKYKILEKLQNNKIDIKITRDDLRNVIKKKDSKKD